MRKWLMRMALAAAVVWPAGALLGQASGQADAERAQQAQDEARLRALVEQERALAGAAAQGHGTVSARAMIARTKMEKAAWLGVRTSNVPPVVRQHLKHRNKYAGLLIEHVEPESPASESGLQQFDIIEKVGDQWIVNKEQFGAVLRMQKPGEPVTLAIIREGEPTEVTAKLIEKELPELALGGMNTIFAPVTVAGEAVLNLGPNGHIRVTDGRIQPMLTLQKLKEEQNFTMEVTDAEHKLCVTTKDGERHLLATDLSGKETLFNGPINTEEEREQVPPEIREKLPELKDLPVAPKATRAAPTTRPAAPQR